MSWMALFSVIVDVIQTVNNFFTPTAVYHSVSTCLCVVLTVVFFVLTFFICTNCCLFVLIVVLMSNCFSFNRCFLTLIVVFYSNNCFLYINSCFIYIKFFYTNTYFLYINTCFLCISKCLYINIDSYIESLQAYQ